jgi:hypothetical protein
MISVVHGQEPVDPDTLLTFEARAYSVREDLIAAGLPVITEDMSVIGSGAYVYIDKLDDAGSGVYVGWAEHFSLAEASHEAHARFRFEDPAVKFAGAVQEAMRDVLAAILRAAGYIVTADMCDYAPYDLHVSGQRNEPSWKHWSNEQFERRQRLQHRIIAARRVAQPDSSAAEKL